MMLNVGKMSMKVDHGIWLRCVHGQQERLGCSWLTVVQGNWFQQGSADSPRFLSKPPRWSEWTGRLVTIVPSPCGQSRVGDSLVISSGGFKPSIQRQRTEAGLDLLELPFRLGQNRTESHLWAAAFNFSSLKPSRFLISSQYTPPPASSS